MDHQHKKWTTYSLYFMLFFLIELLIVICFLKFESSVPPSFGVVDVQALVQFEAQKLSKALPPKAIRSEKLAPIANRLKRQVALWAHQHQVMVLAKGAVWGGDLPDYTEMILEHLKEVQDEKK